MKATRLTKVALLLAAVCLPLFASADDFQVGSFWYTINEDGKSASVVQHSSYRAFEGALIIPDAVQYSARYYPVTAIANSAFYACSRLTSVTLGANISTIGNFAFSACGAVTRVTLPTSLTSIGNGSFGSCVGLTSVTLPASLTTIGVGAFQTCSSLTSVTIPASVTSIGSGAFSSCEALSNMTVATGNTRYDSRGNCKAIVETASNTLISGCKNSTIPSSVTSIGQSAFSGCTGLKNLSLPASVTSIGSFAFQGCTGLTNLTIPATVALIGNVAFVGCSGLSSIVVEAGNPHYDSRDNCNAIIETPSSTLLTGCKNTVIPSSVTTIGMQSFLDCTGLTNITIPSSVTSIGAQAFSDCTGLKRVNIPSSVRSIGDSGFYHCTNLTRIDAYPAPAYVTLGRRVFTAVPKDRTLHVLPKYMSAYQTADQWNEFTPMVADLTDPFKKGDVNGDGNVGATDIACVVNVLAGLEDAAQYGGRADVTGDGGAVTAADIAAIVNILAGLEH